MRVRSTAPLVIFERWTDDELTAMITAAGGIAQGYDDDQIRNLVGGNAARLLGLDEPRNTPLP